MDITILQNILTPIFVILATQGVKKINLLPINAGQNTRIRTFTAILSFGSTLLMALADGKLDSVLGPEMIEVGVNAVIVFLLSHIGFKAAKPLGGKFFKK